MKDWKKMGWQVLLVIGAILLMVFFMHGAPTIDNDPQHHVRPEGNVLYLTLPFRGTLKVGQPELVPPYSPKGKMSVAVDYTIQGMNQPEYRWPLDDSINIGTIKTVVIEDLDKRVLQTFSP